MVIFVFYFTKLRQETNLLRQQYDAQAQEHIQRKQDVEELEEKEKTAKENVSLIFACVCVCVAFLMFPRVCCCIIISPFQLLSF